MYRDYTATLIAMWPVIKPFWYWNQIILDRQAQDRDGFELLVPFDYWEINENENIFLC